MLTQEQLEVRRTGVGASEVAAVVGWSPWQSPMSIYNLKLGITQPETNEYMEAGSWLEHSIAEWFSSRANVKLQRVNHTMRHKTFPWALATPDRIVLGEGRKHDHICEIKTVGRTTEDWGEEGSDTIPKYYFAQCQWILEVTGHEVCDVVALFMDSRRLRTYRVERHAQLAEFLIDEVGDFWNNHVVPKIPPTIDSSDDSKTYLHATFRDPSEQIIDAPDAAEKYVASYFEAKKKLDEAMEQYDLSTNMLKAYIGQHAGMRGPWGTATWKMTRSNGVDYRGATQYLLTELQNVGVDIPLEDIEKQFTKPGFRKLNVKKPRDRR